MTKLSWMTKAGGVLLLWAATAVALPAQTFTTLFSFDGTDGDQPEAALVQGSDGNLYGTTNYGGASNACDYGCGTALKITPSGTLTRLHNFTGYPTGGDGPEAALIQGNDGNFYGTTGYGGINKADCFEEGCGTIFKITPSGTLTTLYNFCSQLNGVDCTDGSYPVAGLTQATNGDFYGTTAGGGTGCTTGCGTVFKITTSGKLTTLHSFDFFTDGFYPNAALVQDADGTFYGTTYFAGTHGAGTVFKITPSGTLTTLYNFTGYPTDGDGPQGALAQGADGDFYGTTLGGGPYDYDFCYDNSCGTIFKITPSGTLTTIYNFCSQSTGNLCTDGTGPYAGVVKGTDGNFYGTTIYGGANDLGTIFQITPSGTLTTLYNFCSQLDCTDGEFPSGGLVQDTNGTFYGTTAGGVQFGQCTVNNQSGCGTVFSLSVGLKPFVETQPTSGVVGAAVKILGTNLTSVTGVTFNGTSAIFTVDSHSLITTTVPAGATSGRVQVIGPGGTGVSNVPFTVRP